MVAIFGAPRRYVQGEGVLANVGAELSRVAQRVLVLLDPMVDGLVGDAIAASARQHGVELQRVVFGGEVTYAELARLRDLNVGEVPDLVLAAGGGKCLDAGKALAQGWNARVAMAPTIASNDAPTSHVYVIYDEHHHMVAVERLLGGNPDFVLVDTGVIVRAPARQLVAGIGDALSKYFEVTQCMGAGGCNVFGGQPLHIAGVLARTCLEQLYRHASAALRAQARGEVDESFERLVEATVLLSGLAFENGGLSISHAVTRGLTAVPETAAAPHGFQVAYGLVVQRVLEGATADELFELLAFMGQVGLPRSLQELAGKKLDASAFSEIALHTYGAPHTANFQRPLTIEDIEQALRQVEAGLL
ncbi:glycerol dehydrogenase [Kerstersia similis]|uniref:glycerol dehydrogenase n=1 Tax=Kerstersia similis TaxID=206505 RepID=UPI0039F0B3C6